MKYCPNCGANVEGLVNHCDCCGAQLGSLPYLRWNGCTVSSVGDVSDHLKIIFDDANLAIANTNLDGLPPIVFTVFCYPPEMIENFNMRDHFYYSRSKKLICVIVIIPYDEFLHSDRDKKRELVKQTICSSFKKIIKSYRKKIPGLEAVVSKVIDSFQ